MNTLRLITIFLIIFLAFSADKLSNNLESKDEIIELQKEKLRLKIDLFNKYDKSLNQRYKTADSIRVIRDSLNVVLSKLINRNNYLINKKHGKALAVSRAFFTFPSQTYPHPY